MPPGWFVSARCQRLSLSSIDRSIIPCASFAFLLVCVRVAKSRSRTAPIRGNTRIRINRLLINAAPFEPRHKVCRKREAGSDGGRFRHTEIAYPPPPLSTLSHTSVLYSIRFSCVSQTLVCPGYTVFTRRGVWGESFFFSFFFLDDLRTVAISNCSRKNEWEFEANHFFEKGRKSLKSSWFWFFDDELTRGNNYSWRTIDIRAIDYCSEFFILFWTIFDPLRLFS